LWKRGRNREKQRTFSVDEIVDKQNSFHRQKRGGGEKRENGKLVVKLVDNFGEERRKIEFKGFILCL
jgi:hypothetical protein